MLMAKLKKGKGRARYFEFLIDSGADFTLISKADAYLLGIDYKELPGKEIKVEVANLAFIHAKQTRFTISIEGHDFTIPVLIAKEEVERLMGRKGIFENFDITFKELEKEVIFKRK
jgi:predicted aspartyl protease